MNKLRQLPIGTQVLLTFGTLSAILVIIGALLFLSLRSIESRIRLQQSRALDKLALIDDTAQDVGQMQAEALREVLTSDIGEIKRLEKSVRDIEQINAKELTDYQKLVDTDKERQLYDRVMQARKVYWEQTQPLLALGLANRDTEAIEFIISKQAPAYDEYLKTINGLIDHVEGEAHVAAAEMTRFISRVKVAGNALAAIAIIIAIGTGFAVTGIGRQLKEDNRLLQAEVAERKQAEVTSHESEEKFSQLAANITDVFWITSPDLKVMHYISPGYELIWGRSTESLYANPHQWVECILAEERERVFAIFGTLTQNEPSVSVEYRIARPDGTIRWVHDRGFQVRDDAGNLVRLTGIVTDITGRKIAEEAARRSQAELRVLFDLVPAMIWFKDTENGILRVNKQVAETTGKSVEEIEGKPSIEIYPKEAAKFYADDLEVIRSGMPKLGIVETFPNREGKELWLETDKVPYCDKDGKVIGIVVMAQNITERKKAEETLRLLSSAVEQSKESIVITDAELNLPGPRILFVNPAFTQMTGYTAEEAIGKTPRILQGLRTDKTVLHRLRQNLERGESFSGEAINYRKNGKEFTLEWQIAPIRNASGSITHFLAIQRDITERKRTESRLRRLVDSNAQGVIFWNVKGEITEANDAFLSLIHYTREDLEAGRINWVTQTPPEYAPLDRHAVEEIAARGICSPYEKELFRKDGSRVPVLLGAAAFEDKTDEGVCYFLDLSERKQLEAQLFQSQKMETVGKLAGGIAHEFNSILTAIIGRSELLLNDLPSGSMDFANAIAIRKAADLAAALTKQLLAYGRKQILRSETLDLNHVLASMEGMLRHLMGAEVDVRIVTAVGLPVVNADAGQIEQVIMNVAINAREAMRHGGKLTLETSTATLGAEYVRHFPEVKPGDYVMIAISDTGTGMSEEVKARLFEPFFTTKSVGEGTGLGLATCHGIIKQSGGHINVYSELGRGTTFKVYLPQTGQRTEVSTAKTASSALPRGTETILLVEDDTSLREMASLLLQRLGYAVLVAANGAEALKLTQQPDTGRIDLLFTDIVMPQMDGKDLSNRVLAIHPETKVLFTSAYTETAIVHQGVLDPGVSLLQKPFTPAALALKVRELLDA